MLPDGHAAFSSFFSHTCHLKREDLASHFREIKLPQQDFAERIARLEAKAPHQPEMQPEPPVQDDRDTRDGSAWLLIAGLIGVALITVSLIAIFVFSTLRKPEQTYASIFSGTSAPAFEGDLTTISFSDHGFQIDIPSDWREMSFDEVQLAGGSLAEVDGVRDIANFTTVSSADDVEFRFNIFTKRTQESDAVVHVAEFQNIMSAFGIVGSILDVEFQFLTEPTNVDFPGLSVAETTVMQRVPGGDVAGIYRAYVVGSDAIIIYTIWSDTAIHPSAFSAVLDSFREI